MHESPDKCLKSLARLLWPSFTIVAQARDGEATFRAIKELRPLLAVLDVSMSKMTGFDVARQLNQAQHSTRVVFLTVQTREEFIAEARRCGHGFVSKMRLSRDLPTALQGALKGEFFTSSDPV
jgi:DNA-binding NarL/FixJ family response regulator